MKKTNINTYLVLFILATCLQSVAQVRSGSAFLKLLPGARAQSMAGSYAAIIDDPHALFANPGSVGFMRQWQWSMSYSKWIADIYNASFLFGRTLQLPRSNGLRWGVGFVYQGVPEFNNDPPALPAASANDFTASLSLGHPFPLFSHRLAVGASAKYFKSTLAQFTASQFIYDIGVIAKSRCYQITDSFESVLSLGAALCQNGRDLKFHELGTPLPKTMRLGFALYMGNHHQWQWVLSTDYVKVRDESGYLAIGGEVMYRGLVAVNFGLDFGNDLMNKLTLGAGIRMDHVGLALGQAFPGRHNSFRIDFATLDESDFFSRTYRGTVTHYSSRPEPFTPKTPANGDSLSTPTIVLSWNPSTDFDVFDKIEYRVFLDHDSVKIAELIHTYQTAASDALELFETELTFNETTINSQIDFQPPTASDYFWAVAAVDRDNQLCFGGRKSGHVFHFRWGVKQD